MSAESGNAAAPVQCPVPHEGVSIARRLDFHGPQPSYFGVPPASASAMVADGFIGDTRQGGGCNAEVITLNPHCHGTHTECVGHVTDARLHAIDVVPGQRLAAVLLTLTPQRAATVHERKPLATADDDRLLTRASLHEQLAALDEPLDALIIRTLPNPDSKRHQQYLDSGDYPYLTLDAVATITDAGVRHLLIDTPSLDRLDDDGELAVHRAFWQLPPGSREVDEHTRVDNTVTEMIFVDDTIPDGRYWLMLQAAPFTGDATPANPVLYPWNSTT